MVGLIRLLCMLAALFVFVLTKTVVAQDVAMALSGAKTTNQPTAAVPQLLPEVAPVGSQFPQLFANADAIYMSWLQKQDDGQASLWFSRWQHGKWSAAKLVARGDDWFVNWADFPSLVALKDGTLVAHWLQKSAPDSYAYDVRLSYSYDDGKSWSTPFSPHDDGSKTEHGFVSLLPQSDNSLSVIWLDGRESHHDHERMQLRHARFDRQGKKLSEQLIDSDTCTCCQTSAINLSASGSTTSDDMLVAYRDHSQQEIRDIAVLRLSKQQWSKPTLVHADGWEIPGCPVNGPALAQHAGQAAVLWYTGAQQQPRVLLAFADAGNKTFLPPQRLDAGEAIGRVASVMPNADTVIASWLERQGELAEWRLRRVSRRLEQGKPIAPVLGQAVTAAQLSLARASGFPRLAVIDDQLLLAWTELADGRPPQVRTAMLALSALP